jgi:hypothetical protein
LRPDAGVKHACMRENKDGSASGLGRAF